MDSNIRPTSHARPFRVLSLDGGGARGWLSAHILRNMERLITQATGDDRPLGHHFDLIAGTSTGAILAAGLATGMSAEALARMYDNHLDRIFKPESHGLFRAKYSARSLARVLEDHFGAETTLADLGIDLCVVAVDLDTASPQLYKTGYLERDRRRLDERVVDVVVASTAAPTYFPAAQGLRHAGPLIDGGLCANNPPMVALLDALQFRRPSLSRGTPPPREMRDVLMVSVGTGKLGRVPYDTRKLLRAGKLSWIASRKVRHERTQTPDTGARGWLASRLRHMMPDAPIIDLAIRSQSNLVDAQVRFLLGEQYLRIDPLLPFPVALDDLDALPQLAALTELDGEQREWLEQRFGTCETREVAP